MPNSVTHISGHSVRAARSREQQRAASGTKDSVRVTVSGRACIFAMCAHVCQTVYFWVPLPGGEREGAGAEGQTWCSAVVPRCEWVPWASTHCSCCGLDIILVHRAGSWRWPAVLVFTIFIKAKKQKAAGPILLIGLLDRKPQIHVFRWTKQPCCKNVLTPGIWLKMCEVRRSAALFTHAAASRSI